MKKFKVLDLFSGIGGMSLGLERSGGFETVAFCEMDEPCQKILKKHWPKTHIFQNVKELTWRNCIGTFDDPDEEYTALCTKSMSQIIQTDVDVIIGGFPCQDISKARAKNKRTGVKGERSGLWKEYARLIGEIRPRYAIIENVEYLRKNGLAVVLNDLAKLGYDAEWGVWTGVSVGLPHQRERLYIVSYPSSQRLDEHTREERHVQTNQEWESQKIHTEGSQCESESVEVRQVLSRRSFEDIIRTFPDRKSAVSKLHRVTDGIPEGLDERVRKERIKQLGNAVIPQIPEVIGKLIMKHEGML